MRITNTIEINSTPEEVFNWLKDPNKAMEWMTSVSRGEIVKQTPNMVGTTFRETIEENGRGTEMEGVIIDYVANRKIAFHLSGKFNTVDVETSLEQVGGITRLSQKANIRFKSFFKITSIILGPLFKKKIIKQSQSELAKLKELCER
jgi:carbon monoxide dehydrogenase subunit G